MGIVRFFLLALALGSLVLVTAPSGCSSSAPDATFDGGGGNGGHGDDDGFDASGLDTGTPLSFGHSDGGGTTQCTGIACNVAACPGGAQTTVTGKVYDPAGKVPLYNVIVYVPNAPLDAFKAGPTCDQCGVVASGDPITSALTDETGTFTLTGVPTGINVPLVMQVGKWRRQVTIPSAVKSCATTTLTDPQLTRLPKNHSEGDMPQMALTTGGCDGLECLFHKMGIDDAEFTNGTGTGRFHVYTGEGGTTIDNSTDAQTFWSSEQNLLKYDIVLMSCECSTYSESKPQAALQAMHDYASAGGRVFGTHYHYYWFQSGPSDFQGTASWTPDGTSGDSATSYAIDQSFPKGASFAKWLKNVGASTTLGQIDLNAVAGDVAGITSSEAQEYIYVPSPDQSAKYFTFNTPVGKPVAQQCGRVVYSDLHVTGSGGEEFPSGCDSGDLTPQEKALEFLFFDLSSCIQDPSKPPPPPPVK